MTIIADFGTSVTCRVVTPTYNERGDVASETYSDSTITCSIQPMAADDEYIKAGILTVGDCYGFFKATDKALIVEGNRIQFQEDWYEIVGRMVFQFGGTELHVEALLKKII